MAKNEIASLRKEHVRLESEVCDMHTQNKALKEERQKHQS